MTTCHSCGVEIAYFQWKTYDGEKYCSNCYKNIAVECADCGEIGKMDDFHEAEVHGVTILVCDHCADDYWKCDDCNILYPDSVASTSVADGDHICRDCFRENYFRCSSCGDVFYNDDYGEDGMCRDCTDDRDEHDEDEVFETRRVIGNVSFRHSPDLDRIIADPRSEM